MGFVSIINRNKDRNLLYQTESMPSFFYDLNFDSILGEIIGKDLEYDPSMYYYLLPKKMEDILFRQGAVKDLENEVLFQGVMEFSKDMAIARKYKNHSEQGTYLLHKETLLLDGVAFYCQAMERLYQSIVDGNPRNEGFLQLKDYLENKLTSANYIGLKEDTQQLRLVLQSFRFTLSLDENKVILQKEIDDRNWVSQVDELLHLPEGKISETFANPFGSVLTLNGFEEKILGLLERRYPDNFSQLNRYYSENKEFMDDVLCLFEQEVQLYMSFIRYAKSLGKKGFFFSFPEISEGEFIVKGCYDIALAEKNSKEKLEVIRNDIEFGSQEKFFVVTGPNQGGKTTFGRAMGQIVYLAMLGLKVPATSAIIPYFNNVLTHFATEESVETGSGKLKEELTRLAPMMKLDCKGSFVVINELFTTATTYDAMIMGGRVMNYLIDNDCRGIYVTHIQELAKEENGVVSVVASVEEGNTHHRTYQMLRQPPMGIGYASDIVEKYQMTYDQLKGRLC